MTSLNLMCAHRQKPRVERTQWRTPPRFSKLMASRNGMVRPPGSGPLPLDWRGLEAQLR